ncbi:MAG: hypothetical protein PT118_14120 [Aphanizomenon gracile PMC644.10]|nr:hypothetical protein [Aphanizomenon gracile PMC644.10]
MLANLTGINVFKSKNNVFSKPAISLNARDILSNYDSRFSEKRIFKFYLKTLIVSWLRDLTYQWKSKIPPGSKELEKIGILAKLKHGETYSQNDE